MSHCVHRSENRTHYVKQGLYSYDLYKADDSETGYQGTLIDRYHQRLEAIAACDALDKLALDAHYNALSDMDETTEYRG